MSPSEAASEEEWLRRALESAPPLTDAQLDRIAAALPPLQGDRDERHDSNNQADALRQ